MKGILFSLFLVSFSAQARFLPYTTRVRDFSGISTTIIGDITNIGMAGATVGIGDTYFALAENPAGLAMTLGRSGFQLIGNTIYDGNLQDDTQAANSSNFLFAQRAYPWAFGTGYYGTFTEGQNYLLPSLGGREAYLENKMRMMPISAARVFWDHRLALGVALNLGMAQRTIELLPSGPSESKTDFGVSGTIGIMLQFPQRFFFGASVTTPMDIGGVNPTSAYIPGFFRLVQVPSHGAFGWGWIPSRFFQAGLAVHVIGGSTNAALLSDESSSVGETVNWQPRIGALYKFAEFPEFEGRFSLGSYVENSRIRGRNARWHFTGAIEVTAWVLQPGIALDAAPRYSNYILSLGVDVVKIMRILEFIPKAYNPPPAGWFPNPGRFDEAGLTRPIVKNWYEPKQEDLFEMTKKLPDRIKNKLQKTNRQLGDLGDDIAEGMGISDEKKELPGEAIEEPLPKRTKSSGGARGRKGRGSPTKRRNP